MYFFRRSRQEGLCDLPHFPTYVIEDNVVYAYDRLVLDPLFESDIRGQLTRALEGEQEDIKSMYATLNNRLGDVAAKEDRIVDLAADGRLPQAKIRETLYEIRVQKGRIEDDLANIESKIAARGELLSKALDQVSDPKVSYSRAPDNVRRLLNETFYGFFRVGDDGEVRAELTRRSP